MDSLEHMGLIHRRSVQATIRARREMSGLMIKEVAYACGVSIDTVNAWLYRDVLPEPKNLRKLDELFGLLT